MEISFNAQPFDDGRDLHDFLNSVAAASDLRHLDIVVAWAKRSGLRRVRDYLETIRDRVGATTRLIVGIDEGGATEQGLRLGLELFTQVYIIHDRSGRTFHPKIYAAWGTSHGRLLVGSNNLTAGGVYYNYETALECTLTWPADEPLKTSVSRYVTRLLTDAAICLELTDERLDELTNSPQYRIGNEDSEYRPRIPLDDASVPEDLDNPSDVGGPLFGLSTQNKRKDPARAASSAGSSRAPEATRETTTPPPAAPSSGPDSSVVIQRWYKEMSHSDAQQPKTPGSNVKGILTLSQARHPITPASWFRSGFFGSLQWISTAVPQGARETATLTAEVFVDESLRGTYRMEVDYQESRTSDQANVPTWLHWNEFGSYLRENDHVGDFVTLERLSDGHFRVTISESPVGPFIDYNS